MQRRNDSIEAGFSLLEMMVVVGIVLILSATAILPARQALASYNMSAASSKVSGILQATRYKAVQSGCSYTIAFDASGVAYQLATRAASGNPPLCANSFSNEGQPVPWTVASTHISVSASATLQFQPNGTICAQGSPACNTSLAGPPFCFHLTGPVTDQSVVPSGDNATIRNITISGVGNVTVTQPTSQPGC